MYLGKHLVTVQFNVFVSLLWFLLFFTIFFSDTADNKETQLAC